MNILLMAVAMICLRETCLAASLEQQKRRIVKRASSAVSSVSILNFYTNLFNLPYISQLANRLQCNVFFCEQSFKCK